MKIKLAIILTMIASLGMAQEASPSRSKQATAVIEKFEAKIKTLNGFYFKAREAQRKEYGRQVSLILTSLMADLESEREKATGNDQLDVAIELRDMKKEFRDYSTLPPDIAKQGTKDIAGKPQPLTPPNIPMIAVEFKGHSYVKFTKPPETWEAAQAYCKSLGGHLVTVNSLEESQFLNTFSQSSLAWTGIHREYETNNWMNADGPVFPQINIQAQSPSENHLLHRSGSGGGFGGGTGGGRGARRGISHQYIAADSSR